MTRDAYVDEFRRCFEEGTEEAYQRAFHIFTEHQKDLVAQLNADEADFAFVEFRNSGRRAEARGFYRAVQQYGNGEAKRLTKQSDFFRMVAHDDEFDDHTDDLLGIGFDPEQL